MTIQIIPISKQQVKGFHAALDEVARERQFIAMIEAKPLRQVRQFVMNNIKTGAPQYVAVDDGRVIGWCDIIPAWTHAVQHRGTLGMGIIASHRGRGIGTQLLSACLDKAKHRGITRVELEARADNANAIHLYTKLGFILEGTLQRGMRVDGTYYNCVQMALLLD